MTSRLGDLETVLEATPEVYSTSRPPVGSPGRCAPIRSIGLSLLEHAVKWGARVNRHHARPGESMDEVKETMRGGWRGRSVLASDNTSGHAAPPPGAAVLDTDEFEELELSAAKSSVLSTSPPLVRLLPRGAVGAPCVRYRRR